MDYSNVSTSLQFVSYPKSLMNWVVFEFSFKFYWIAFENHKIKQ